MRTLGRRRQPPRDSRDIAGERDDPLLETIMPDQPGPHWAKLLDIQMLTMLTGRERTRAEYAKLLADEKFRVERVVETRSDVQILEAIPV